MKHHLSGLMALAFLLTPVAASAQYYEAGPRPYGHDHVERYDHGDHEDVVVRHHHSYRDDGFERRSFYERGHHHDDD